MAKDPRDRTVSGRMCLRIFFFSSFLLLSLFSLKDGDEKKTIMRIMTSRVPACHRSKFTNADLIGESAAQGRQFPGVCRPLHVAKRILSEDFCDAENWYRAHGCQG